MEPKTQVSNLINCLTNDEDLRQELWVYYLNGNPIESFPDYLNKLQLQYADDFKLKKAIHQIIQNPLSDNVLEFLDNFTDFERSIICLSMLDLTIERISAIKGISEVRIRQTIANIRYNSIWEKYYGIKKEPIR